ncbi:MAG TPA: MBL fold metallo-hydrolase, partial [Hyphomicrobiales bacterium]|nr:MBL fold metallo-hydrolase [Hyphomicrobiales bacterium]
MTLRVTILGCGSSTGVPRVGNDWGACNPNNPKNRRRRCSLLVEKIGPEGRTIALIDTSPDLREQLLSAEVKRLDGVIYTHDHADHTHGIDDLRILAYAQRRRIDVWAEPRTLGLLKHRFDYCFETPPGSSYPAIVTAHIVTNLAPITISGPGGDLTFQPFRQIHGDIDTLGLRTEGLAYSCDLNDLPEDSLPHLRNLDVWILNTLRYNPHPSHLTLGEALEWIDRMRPKRAVLTHLHIDLDYDELSAKLPPGVEPA